MIQPLIRVIPSSYKGREEVSLNDEDVTTTQTCGLPDYLDHTAGNCEWCYHMWQCTPCSVEWQILISFNNNWKLC